MPTSRCITAALLTILAACGTTPEARAPATSTAEAGPSAAPVEIAPAAKVAPDADGADGIRRWASWEGPKAGAAIAGKRAWVIGPAGVVAGSEKLSFSAVKLRVVDVEKADAAEVVFKDRGQRYAVPAALAWPADPPRGLAKGAPARCAFAGGSAIARIESADARNVTCAFRDKDKTRRERVPVSEVRNVMGRLEPGAPALVRFGSDLGNQYRAWVITVGGEEVWVALDTQLGEHDPHAGRAAHRVRATNVEVIDVSKPHKVGDVVLATDVSIVVPGTVTKVIEGGLAYAIDLAGGAAGGRTEWPFDEIAAAPKK